MKKIASYAVVVASLLSTTALAQDGAVATDGGWALAFKYLAAGLAIGIAVLGGATGQGRASATALEGIGRNPQSADKMFTPMLLALALIEFQTIMAFIIAILLVIG